MILKILKRVASDFEIIKKCNRKKDLCRARAIIFNVVLHLAKVAFKNGLTPPSINRNFFSHFLRVQHLRTKKLLPACGRFTIPVVKIL